MNSIYLIIKLCVRKTISYFAFSACVHVSVMGSCGTSKVQEFPLLAEKVSCCVVNTFLKVQDAPHVYGLLQIYHFSSFADMSYMHMRTQRQKSVYLQRLSTILHLGCS